MNKERPFILDHVARHIKLDQKEESFFLGLLEEKSIGRKEFILREKEVSKASIYVVKGCLRSYTIDENGFEHILQFAPPDWWMADMYSLISQKPGNLNMDAIEESELLLLYRKDQEILFHEIPKFERFFRILTENALIATRQRLIENLSLKAKQRFAGFCRHYPNLIEHIPQKYIASYIGVTPEFLSKLKAEYFRNQSPHSSK
jgi:CRP-like cAMP-binding protein